LAAVDGIGPP